MASPSTSIEAILALDAGDAGCGTTCAVLERYVEAELAGQDAGVRFPAVAAHLDRCAACRTDHEGLLAITASQSAGPCCR